MNASSFPTELEMKGTEIGSSYLPWSKFNCKLKKQDLRLSKGTDLIRVINIRNCRIEETCSGQADNKPFPFSIKLSESKGKFFFNASTGEVRARCIEMVTSAAEDQDWAERNRLPFPSRGISLYYLREFVHTHNRNGELVEMTTADVVEVIIKPLTVEDECSVCDLLAKTGNSANHHVSQATVFISHAWRCKFLDVVNLIGDHFERGKSDAPGLNEAAATYIWFDVFCNNQHKFVDYDFEWWCDTFQTAIKTFSYTVLILPKWDDPVPLSRAWCIWELYCTIKTSSKLDIALSEVEEEKFIEEVTASGLTLVESLFEYIDSGNSCASKTEDKAKIHFAVNSIVGFNKLDSLIRSKLKEWAESVILRRGGQKLLTDFLNKLFLQKRYSEFVKVCETHFRGDQSHLAPEDLIKLGISRTLKDQAPHLNNDKEKKPLSLLDALTARLSRLHLTLK
jgi:hypothetical protein